MSFVLCNASTTFMRPMNDVSHPYLDSFIIVYLDSILVYSATWEDHISLLMQVRDSEKTSSIKQSKEM
jgi:hypothetical protein